MRRLADYIPLTWTGLALGLCCAALLWWPAFREIDYVALVVGAAGLVLLALDFILVVLAALAVRDALYRGEAMESSANTSTLETGKFSRTGFSMPALRWFPLLEWWWMWLEPAAAEVRWAVVGGRRQEAVNINRRQRIRSVQRRLVVQDAFGLVSLALRDERALDWLVLPHRAAIGKYQPIAAWIVGDLWPHPQGVAEGDYVDLRRYVPGDPARLIHWKVFSRTRRLMVRTQEQAKSPAQRTFAYLIAADADEASSAVARAVIEDDALGSEWRFAVDGEPASTADARSALRMIATSSAYDGAAASGLSRFADEAQKQGPAHLLVFAPHQPGPWLQALHRTAQTTGQEIHVVIGVDGVQRNHLVSKWRRRLFQNPPHAAADYDELQNVVQQLSKSHCVVTIVDRITGRVVRSTEGLQLSSLKVAA